MDYVDSYCCSPKCHDICIVIVSPYVNVALEMQFWTILLGNRLHGGVVVRLTKVCM